MLLKPQSWSSVVRVGFPRIALLTLLGFAPVSSAEVPPELDGLETISASDLATRITVNFVDLPADEALERIGVAGGQPVVFDAETDPDDLPVVSIETEDTPVWTVVFDVAEQVGRHVSLVTTRDRLQIGTRADRRLAGPRTVSGPFLFALTRLNHVERQTFVPDAERSATFVLSLVCVPEPGLDLAGYQSQLWVERAIDSEGEDLTLADQTPGEIRLSMASSRDMRVAINEPHPQASELETLDLVAYFVRVSDEVDLRIGNVRELDSAAIESGPYEFSVTEVRDEQRGVVAIDFTLTRGDDVSDLLWHQVHRSLRQKPLTLLHDGERMISRIKLPLRPQDDILQFPLTGHYASELPNPENLTVEGVVPTELQAVVAPLTFEAVPLPTTR